MDLHCGVVIGLDGAADGHLLVGAVQSLSSRYLQITPILWAVPIATLVRRACYDGAW
jgi:hypothetical protein